MKTMKYSVTINVVAICYKKKLLSNKIYRRKHMSISNRPIRMAG